MVDIYDLADDPDALWFGFPVKSASAVLRMRYDRLLNHVAPSMLPPRDRIEFSALGQGGMGTAFGLSRGYELSGWVLKLTIDPGEAAVGALIAQAGGIPGLIPVHAVLDLDVDVVDTKSNHLPPARVFALWRRLVVPVLDFSDKVLEDDLMDYADLAYGATNFGNRVFEATESACDALSRVAPTVTDKYVRDPDWVEHVNEIVRFGDRAQSASKYSKAGRSIARHLATYIHALSQSQAFGAQDLGDKLLDFLSKYDIVLCDLAARNIGLFFRSEYAKPELAIYDFGMPRFLTKDHDSVTIESA